MYFSQTLQNIHNGCIMEEYIKTKECHRINSSILKLKHLKPDEDKTINT